MNAKYAASCFGKEAYDKATARRLARAKNSGVRPDGSHYRRRTTGPDTLSAFKCAFCGHWHVGAIRRPKAPRQRPALDLPFVTPGDELDAY